MAVYRAWLGETSFRPLFNQMKNFIITTGCEDYLPHDLLQISEVLTCACGASDCCGYIKTGFGLLAEILYIERASDAKISVFQVSVKDISLPQNYLLGYDGKKVIA